MNVNMVTMPARRPRPTNAPNHCCPPAPVGRPSDDVRSAALRFKALADPVRLQLLALVADAEGGEACVCDLNAAFDLSQPTISHHLKVLHDAGLLQRDKRGVWVYYRVDASELATLAGTLNDLAAPSSSAGRPSPQDADAPRATAALSK